MQTPLDEFVLAQHLIAIIVEGEHQRVRVHARVAVRKVQQSADDVHDLLRLSPLDGLVVVDVVDFEHVRELLARLAFARGDVRNEKFVEIDRTLTKQNTR